MADNGDMWLAENASLKNKEAKKSAGGWQLHQYINKLHSILSLSKVMLAVEPIPRSNDSGGKCWGDTAKFWEHLFYMGESHSGNCSGL